MSSTGKARAGRGHDMKNPFSHIPTISEEELARLMKNPNWSKHTQVHFDYASGQETCLEALVEICSGRMVVRSITTLEVPRACGKSADVMIIDDPDHPRAYAKERALEWMSANFPPSFRRVRAIRHVQLGALVALDREVSDRAYPDIDQMLLDCGHPLA